MLQRDQAGKEPEWRWNTQNQQVSEVTTAEVGPRRETERAGMHLEEAQTWQVNRTAEIKEVPESKEKWLFGAFAAYLYSYYFINCAPVPNSYALWYLWPPLFWLLSPFQDGDYLVCIFLVSTLSWCRYCSWRFLRPPFLHFGPCLMYQLGMSLPTRRYWQTGASISTSYFSCRKSHSLQLSPKVELPQLENQKQIRDKVWQPKCTTLVKRSPWTQAISHQVPLVRTASLVEINV